LFGLVATWNSVAQAGKKLMRARPAALKGSAGGRACTARRLHEVRDGAIPGRRGGSMVSRCLPAQGTGRRSGAGGGTRTLTSDQAQRIFIPPTAFAARTRHFGAHASGLWSGLSLHRLPENPGLRCCPSSLYTFPAGAPTGLGSGSPFQVSPNLSSSASPVSRTNTQVSLSP